MKTFLLLALAAVSVRAEQGAPACVTATPDYYLAKIENPAANFAVLAGPKAFRDVCGAGAVVTNGTFFAPGAALGDVVVDGAVKYSPRGKDRRFKKDDRWIDLGRRWGVGVLRGSGLLAVADGDEALDLMETFLGGGGLLLEKGEIATAENAPRFGQWSASLPSSITEDARGRVALGLKVEDGKQVLLLLKTKNAAGATVERLAELMKSLGASDAVFYDGGGAQGYAMGGRCLILPSNPGEDVNPTHIVVKACR